MTGTAHAELPQDRVPDLKKAIRLEWLTIAYLLSAILILALVLGSSQALKTAWFDDLLSLAPSILFLVGSRIATKKPTENYPYGFGAAVSAGYLGASVALLGVGGYLLLDAGSKLLEREHPTIGGVSLFGHVVWQGWLAVPVLIWSGVPAVFLGRAKLPLADRLHDKVLLADARINEADWQTAGAALLGIVGVAFGLWWADSAAAALISLDIIRDGFRNVRDALNDLIDRRPQSLTDLKIDPLPTQLADFLQGQDWVEDAVVRLREQGRHFMGEALVVPKIGTELVDKIQQAAKAACDLDWRLIQLTISPVRELPPEAQETRSDKGATGPQDKTADGAEQGGA